MLFHFIYNTLVPSIWCMYVSGSTWRTGQTCLRLVLSALSFWAGHPSLPPSLTWREWIQLDCGLCLRYIHFSLERCFHQESMCDYIFEWSDCTSVFDYRHYDRHGLSFLSHCHTKTLTEAHTRKKHYDYEKLLCLSAVIKCVKRNLLNT